MELRNAYAKPDLSAGLRTALECFDITGNSRDFIFTFLPCYVLAEAKQEFSHFHFHIAFPHLPHRFGRDCDMTTHGTKRPLPTEDENQAPRPRKKPGSAARVSTADKDAALRRQQQREEEARKALENRGLDDVVRQHYNAVPQRGVDWRKTDSRIKGLRSFNNWVKSTIIHKFSPNENGSSSLRVLDVGCGKGGDLGKWQKAPQRVDLYVGVDPAEISIEQARERYAQMSRKGAGGRGGFRGGRPQRTFDAEFFVQDAFGQSLGDLSFIREVGFDDAGGSRWGGGGFDVVSMMFCMHYAFESERKARGMLQNVASTLKKGGRFIGTIPNSDIIRSKVERFHTRLAENTKPDVKGKPRLKRKASDPADEQSRSTLEVITTGEGTEQPQNEPPAKKVKLDASGTGSVPPYDETNDITRDQQPHENVVEPSPKDASPQDEKKKSADNDQSLHKASSTPPCHQSPQNQETESPKEIMPPYEREAKSPSDKHSSNRDQAESVKKDQSPNGGAQVSSMEHQTASEKEAKETDKPVADWGNSLYRVRFPGPTPKDGVFRPPFGWKYSYFMEEAVEEVPEYVVPWEAFRA